MFRTFLRLRTGLLNKGARLKQSESRRHTYPFTETVSSPTGEYIPNVLFSVFDLFIAAASCMNYDK